MNISKFVTGGLTLAVLTVVTVVSLASKPSEQTKTEGLSKRVSQSWYYKLTSMDPADLNNAANYQSTPLTGVTCGSGDIVCRIEDEASTSDSNIPALSHGNVSSNLTAYQADFKEAE